MIVGQCACLSDVFFLVPGMENALCPLHVGVRAGIPSKSRCPHPHTSARQPSSWLPVPTPWAGRLEGDLFPLSHGGQNLRSRLPPGGSFPRLSQASLPALGVAGHPWWSLRCSTSLNACPTFAWHSPLVQMSPF